MNQFTIRACQRTFLENPRTNNSNKPLVHSYYGFFKGKESIPSDSIHGALQHMYYFRLPSGGVINLSQKHIDHYALPIYTGGSDFSDMQRMTQPQIDAGVIPFFSLKLNIIREQPLSSNALLSDDAKIQAPADSKIIRTFDNEVDARLMWGKMLNSARSIPICTMKLQSKDRPQNCNSTLRTIADDCDIPLKDIIFPQVDQWGIQTNLKKGMLE